MRRLILSFLILTFLLASSSMPVIADDAEIIPIITEEFDGELDSKWVCDIDENLGIVDGCLRSSALSSNRNATLTLPEPISKGKIEYKMKFKYKNSKGINLVINNGSGQGSLVILGQDNSNNDRIWITNADQTAFENAIQNNNGEPGDNEFHTLVLVIDMDSAGKPISVIYDDDEIAVTGYAQDAVAKINFTFNGGKVGDFYIDTMSVSQTIENDPTDDITELVIDGTPKVGHTLTVSGTDLDVNWYVSDTEDGDYKAVNTGKSYTVDVSSVGKWIKAGIGSVYSEPVMNSTEKKDIYSNEFNEELGDEWNAGAAVSVKDGNLICQSNTKDEAILTLPAQASSGMVAYEMKFKYQAGKGIALNINNGGEQGALLHIGQDNSGTDRIFITNEKQNGFYTVVSSVGGNPGDGEYHTLLLAMDLSTRVINVIYDGEMKVSTKYSQTSVAKLAFDFNDGKAGIFHIDSMRLFTYEDDTADKKSLALKEIKLFVDGAEMSPDDAILESGTANAAAYIDNFSGAKANIQLVSAVYSGDTLKSADVMPSEVMSGFENVEIKSNDLGVNAGDTVKIFVLKNNVDSAKIVAYCNIPENSSDDVMNCKAVLDVDERSLQIKGTVSEAADREILIIIRENEKDGKIAAITSVKPNKELVFDTTIKIDKDNSAENFKLITALNNNGKRNSEEAEAKYELDFCMPNNTVIGNYISDLNSGDSKIFENAVNELVSKKIILSEVSDDVYESHKDEILTMVFDYVNNNKISKLSSFDSDMTAFYAMTAMKYAEDKNVCFKQYAKVLGCDMGEKYDVIETKVGTVYEILTSSATLSLPDKIVDLFDMTIAISYVNSVGADTMDSVLQRYNDIFKLELDGDYDKLNKIDVGKYLVNKDFESIKEIQDAFENGVSAVKKKSKDKGAGGGGGGGSSSSSGSSIHSVPIHTNVQQTITMQENTEMSDYPKKVQDYSDVAQSRWSYEYIKALTEKGIINGNGGAFYPENNITREEFAKMLVLAVSGYNSSAVSGFEDVPEGAWYNSYVASAYDLGIVKGIDETMFGAGRNISREDMAVMVYRTLQLAISETDTLKSYNEFEDSETISDYAREAVRTLYCCGVINGFDENRFAPKSPSTREQAAAMIFNMLSLIQK